MYVYLSKKISIPNNTNLKQISWCRAEGFIACGGEEGLLKVLKLEASKTAGDAQKGLGAPSNLSVNQNLEGHSGAVQVIVWNEVYQKLTTSDEFGLIIVWMMYRGSWYEEMINNRNKSVVSDMAWSSDGSKICIVYEDGVVIVGSVDGNRLWGKEVKGTLKAVEWSPSCKLLLFGFANSEVHAFDNDGNFVSKLPIRCLDQVEDNDLLKVEWFSLKWARPPGPGGQVDPDSTPVAPAPSDPSVPHLAVVYRNGLIQLMRNENDPDGIVTRLEGLAVVSAQWNSGGGILAVAGQEKEGPVGENNIVEFLNPLGERLRTLKVPGTELVGCSWDALGLRLCLAVDSHVFFANIRPDYKWGYCGETIVYSYSKADRAETYVAFWDVRLEEVFVKHVKDLLSIASHGELCTLVNRADDPTGAYLLQLCNGIGTPIDFKYIDLEPLHVAMSASQVVVASKDAFFIWHFSLPRKAQRKLGLQTGKEGRKDLFFHVDEIVTDHSLSTDPDAKKSFPRTSDPITCICATNICFMIGRESGLVQRYAPNGTLEQKYQLGPRPERLALNVDATRLGLINTSSVLTLWELEKEGPRATQVPGVERKDVWDMAWDEDKAELLAIMEKTRLFILRGSEAEEPIVNSGYICRFSDLSVRTVLLDELTARPEEPDKDSVVEVEIKSLRDAKVLLERTTKISEASAYIEANPHPKLWRLLAEVALNHTDTATAEHAFVKLRDFAGIQLIKKLNAIGQEALKKAEIAAYFGRLDEAEKMYLDLDRRDLALALRKKVHDWFRILQLLQMGGGAGDDELLQQAWNHVGDYFAHRQKWLNAQRHYEPARNLEALHHCYVVNEDYEKLEQLMRSLPERHPLLPKMAQYFASTGLAEQAVDAYKKAGQMKDALDACIQLNQWELAVSLAKATDGSNIEELLEKHAAELTADSDKSLTAVQLFRQAGKFLDAAAVLFGIADEERARGSPPLRLKKLYVAAALLVEDFHKQKKKGAEAGGKGAAAAALSGLLAEEGVSVQHSKLIDGAWRGAEAYHFLMLAQRQLYQGHLDLAMKTALHLGDYDDLIDAAEVHSLLALVSCAHRQLGVCSRAFIKLQSLPALSQPLREAYDTLALSIFTKHAPKDTRTNKAECTGCETLIPDFCQICPSCDTKFPTCIVTGRPLMDYQFWLCPVCKHRAYEQEIQTHKHCPLCHAPI